MGGHTKQGIDGGGGALKSVEIYCCELVVSSLVLLPWCLAAWIVCFSFCKCAQI